MEFIGKDSVMIRVLDCDRMETTPAWCVNDEWSAACDESCFPQSQNRIYESAMTAFFKPLIDWYQDALLTGGYFLVALLMAVESSIVPLPSEVVIPPAAHLAHTGQLNMSLWGIALAGTIGSWLGASAMYWAARWAGRPIVMRYGKYLFISPAKVEGAERWAARYGALGVFVSRLLPVVRHLIGIPAGIVRMSYWKFSAYTVLGSAIWCAVLCWVGVKMGEDLKQAKNMTHTFSLWCGGLTLAIGLLYYLFVHRQMKKESRDSGGAGKAGQT
jgi:membrane protein DedA with SNARE-associated domain